MIFSRIVMNLMLILSICHKSKSMRRVLTDPSKITDIVFAKWAIKYGITFNSTEERDEALKKFQTVFMSSIRQKLEYYTWRSNFTMEPNKFALFSDKTVLNGATISDIFQKPPELSLRAYNLPVYPTPPPTLDYRTMGYVSSVKDQGFMCSSCYAFAAICGIEGQIFKKYGRMHELSPQNIVDCSTSLGNMGCDGGSIGLTFKYAVTNPGVSNETTYPYAGYEQNCYYNPSMYAEKVLSYTYVTGDENYLKSVLAAIGPLPVGMKGSLDSFYYYSSGIYDDPACTTQVDHAVCLVGYGTDNSTNPPTNYWIAKNSWSEWWGENGYFRLKMGSNLCGIRNYVVYPNV